MKLVRNRVSLSILTCNSQLKIKIKLTSLQSFFLCCEVHATFFVNVNVERFRVYCSSINHRVVPFYRVHGMKNTPQYASHNDDDTQK